jgi:beta-glucosidase
MRTIGFLALAAGSLAAINAGAAAGSLTAEDIDNLLAQMTVAEKAGQMTQLNISVIIDGEETPESPFTISDEKLRDIVVTHGVGSLFGVWHGALPLDRWRDLVGQIQELAVNDTRLGIPVVFADDSVHGANYLLEGTILPHNLNLAATWNPELAHQSGRVTAKETRAKATHWTFAPVADLGRQAQWSRVFETFGEDPLLASVMASNVIEGLEGDTLDSDLTVASTVKHFLGYSIPASGRDRTPVYMSRGQLVDTHLPSFRAAIDAGAATIMINSGEINGIPVHADPAILIDLLRGELGFEGVAVTDWRDIGKLVDVHRVAPDEKEATRIALEAGVDMSMVAQSTSFTTDVVELVSEGRLSESTLDRSVRRILKLKDDLGLFENPVGGEDAMASVGSREHHRISHEAARESLVLLRNGGPEEDAEAVLPLADDAKILVTGPASDELFSLYGAWSYTWQGQVAEWYPDTPTIADALAAKFGEDSVTHVAGSGFTEASERGAGIDAAVSAAGDADAIVLCLGEMGSTERPGDLDSFTLDRPQLDLARAMIDTGKPVILVMVTNRARPFGEVEAGMDAVVWAGEPGPHGSTAIAELLAGDFSPSGRLPFTYPRHPGALMAYDRKESETLGIWFQSGANAPLFEFGSGLSYSTVEYEPLLVSWNGREAKIMTTVTNTGDRTTKEVVQLYATDLVATVTPYSRRLKGFDKIELEPGESKTVGYTLTKDDLLVTFPDGKQVFEPGDFRFTVGDQQAEITIR